MKLRLSLYVFAVLGSWCAGTGSAATIRSPYGISYQVNVDSSGANIPGDAAGDPSLCIDPTNPSRMAIGWAHFFFTSNANHYTDQRAGVAYTTNGGLSCVFPGVLAPNTNVNRTEPALAADANGTFYYFHTAVPFTNINGLLHILSYQSGLLRSTNGGINWQDLGEALGGDTPWMAIDTTSGPGAATFISRGARFLTTPMITPRCSAARQTVVPPGWRRY